MITKKFEDITHIHKTFRNFMSVDNICAHVKIFIEAINTYLHVPYFGIFIPKEIYEGDKALISIAHTAPINNKLLEMFKSEFKNTFSSFNINVPIDYRSVDIKTFDLNNSAISMDKDIKTIFQMPLVRNGMIIGALVIMGSSDRELTLYELTVLGLISDQFSIVCENRLLIENIQKISITDELTGLFNRRHTLMRLEEEFIRSQRYYIPLSIIMADVDHFKRFNDTFGHQTGDTVLETIGAVLRKNIRNTDIVGRYGGEEFLFILPHTPLDGTKSLIKRIQKDLMKTNLVFNGQHTPITLSFGISTLLNGKKIKLNKFLESADNALYCAKKSGRNKSAICSCMVDKIEYSI